MSYQFKFPDIGEGIHEGKILEWYYHPGDKVTEGDPLLKVETDKVVTDIPVPQTGILHSIHGEVDEVIEVGHVVAVIAAEGEEVEVPAATKTRAAAVVEEDDHMEDVDEGFGVVGHIPVDDAVIPLETEGREESPAAPAGNGRRALATPVAKKMARELGLDINTIKGTGPGGRVMKSDIKRAVEAKGTPGIATAARTTPPTIMPATAAGELVEVEALSQIRKSVAARMTRSKFTAPHSTQLEEVEVSRLVEIRARKNEELAKDGIKLSFLPYIMKALTIALQKHKKLNCRLDIDQGQVSYFKYYNIGIAVDTEAGLVVPVIRDADKLRIIELGAAITDISDRARKRELSLDEIQGGTFTVTNYGALNGSFGIPVINYPEVAILGVGRIKQQPVIRDGEIVKGWVLPLSLSFDHRIVDGGDSARFLNDFMAMLNDPINMLMF